jgi:excisionase family DNA binding protein
LFWTWHATGNKPMHEFLTLREVAQYLRFSESTVYRMVKKGKGPPAIKVGKVWRWSKASVDQWVEEQYQNNKHNKSKS